MSTSWAGVFILFLVGASTALLLGKVPVVLPILQSDFDLSLFQAGLLVSIFSLIAAALAAIIGAIADRFGQLRVAVLGLVIASLASIGGIFAPSATLLMASRVLEGLGFFLVSASIPPLMMQITAPEDRQKALGMWGAFVPVGLSVVMLSGGLIADAIGWQGLWLMTTTALLIALGSLLIATRNIQQLERPQNSIRLISTYQLLLLPGPLLMALIFIGYSAQFMTVTAFLPLILVQNYGWAVASAGLAAGVVVACNIIGNVASGILLDRGLRRQTVILVACCAMGLGTIGAFSELLPVGGRLAGAALFAAVGGLIPGALFAGTPNHTPHPSRLSAVNGLLMQGAALGQVSGPPIAAVFVGLLNGWNGLLWFTVPAAIVTAFLAMGLGKLEATAR